MLIITLMLMHANDVQQRNSTLMSFFSSLVFPSIIQAMFQCVKFTSVHCWTINFYLVLISVVLHPQKNKNMEAKRRRGEDASPSVAHREINRQQSSRLSGLSTNKSPRTLAAQRNRSADISAEAGRKSTDTPASEQVDHPRYLIFIRRRCQRRELETAPMMLHVAARSARNPQSSRGVLYQQL